MLNLITLQVAQCSVIVTGGCDCFMFEWVKRGLQKPRGRNATESLAGFSEPTDRGSLVLKTLLVVRLTPFNSI